MNAHHLYKLVIISDTNHDISRLERLLPVINQANYLVFCGDYIADLMRLRNKIAIPIICVKGNKDIEQTQIADVTTVMLGKTKVLIAHGHTFGVSQDMKMLFNAAKQNGCRLVFFGHTRKYIDYTYGGIHFVNPGGLCNGSYALVAGDGVRFASKNYIIQ